MASYSANTGILFLGSLLAVPAMVRASGEIAWGEVTVGQAVGSLGAVLLGFGWAVSGPADVARATNGERRGILRQSVLIRLALLLPVFFVSAALAVALSPGHTMYAAIGSLAAATQGLTSRWYFIGVSRPLGMFFGDTLPRSVATFGGIALMEWFGAGVEAGVYSQFVGIALGGLITYILVLHWTQHEQEIVPSLSATLSNQLRNTWTNLTSTIFVSAPIVIVGVLAPSVLGQYALYDRTARQAMAGVQPFSQMLQGWVPRMHGNSLRRRALQATGFSGIATLAILGVGALTAERFLAWLGGGVINVNQSASILVCAIVGLSLVEITIARACLIPMGRVDAIATVTLLGSAIGLGALVVGADLFGSSGALAGVALGLLLRCAGLLIVMLRVPPANY